MKKIQIFSISLGFLIVFLLGFGANVLFFNDDSIEVYANNNMETIVIDAGHGGYDVGCIALDGTQEKDITLDIASSTGELLEEAGYNVVYTRTSDNVSWPEDNKEDLQSRIDIAEDADANNLICFSPQCGIHGPKLTTCTHHNKSLTMLYLVDIPTCHD